MKINAEIDYTPSPEDLADEFCDLFQEGQARFLNRVAFIFNECGCCLSTQLEYITKTKELSDEARHVMHKFGEYAFHNQRGD